MTNCYNCSEKIKKGEFRCEKCLNAKGPGSRLGINYNERIDRGVTRADLIQPMKEDGTINYEYMKRYGDKHFGDKQKEKLRKNL